MKNWRCFFWIHNWWLEDSDYETPTEKVMRTYERCARCRLWGKPFVGMKYNKLTGEKTKIFNFIEPA